MNSDYIKIKNDLRSIGIKKGDRVLIHSSYKSLGGVEGGIDTFISAVKDTVGTDGTVMFPTFTYDFVNKDNPVFDIEKTPSCVGMIPEVFRKGKGVKRSLHPTHSVAVWGKDRDWYIEKHHKDKVCVGENSPIYKLKDTGGKILMVGCGITHNTLIHGLEILVRPPYAMAVDYTDPEYHREYSCIDENKNVFKQEFFHVFYHAMGYYSDFGKLNNIMEIKNGYILNAESFLMDAKTVWDTVYTKMQEDPYYFVHKA